MPLYLLSGSKQTIFLQFEKKNSDIQCNYIALVREAFTIYTPVKRLSFYLHNAKCTMLYDH